MRGRTPPREGQSHRSNSVNTDIDIKNMLISLAFSLYFGFDKTQVIVDK